MYNKLWVKTRNNGEVAVVGVKLRYLSFNFCLNNFLFGSSCAQHHRVYYIVPLNGSVNVGAIEVKNVKKTWIKPLYIQTKYRTINKRRNKTRLIYTSDASLTILVRLYESICPAKTLTSYLTHKRGFVTLILQARVLFRSRFIGKSATNFVSYKYSRLDNSWELPGL
jgi:hypothetical protein